MAEDKQAHDEISPPDTTARRSAIPLGAAAAAATPAPADEDTYWREAYAGEPYYLAGSPYEDYRPAYQLGWTTRLRLDDDFDSIEPSLAHDWEQQRDRSRLTWPQARPAARAAWQRMHSSVAQEVVDNSAMIDILNDLLEICRDGEFGFNACAEHTQGESLRNLFKQHARECRDAAGDLQEQVIRLGGEPVRGGSTSGALHRGWVAVCGTLKGHTDQAMLDESERGEDIALEHYRHALSQPLSLTVRALVQRQLDGVKANHDQLKGIRDMHRSQHPRE